MSSAVGRDVLIVGAGPAGLTAALVLGRQHRGVAVVDAGCPRNESVQDMHMYLGREGAPPAELRRLAQAEVAAHPNVLIMSGEVSALADEAGHFSAVVGDDTITARVVLLAGGVRDVLGDLPGLAERWGRQVHRCAFCHGFESLGKSIAVLARAPSDAVLARYLADRFSSEVTLVVGDLTDQGQARSIANAGGLVVEPGRVVALSGGPDITTLELEDGRALAAHVVFYNPPYVLSNSLATDLGCDLTDAGLIAVAPTMATSVPGVYAAGDAAMQHAATTPVQFVTSAAADGQRAAVWIEQQLFAATLAT